jgi:nucleotide-binding universal stress UspA family protein
MCSRPPTCTNWWWPTIPRDLVRPAVQLLQAAGLQVEQDVATGDPAHTLVEILERHACGAVILSAHGSSGNHTQIGSVAHELVQISPVPVTVVRTLGLDRD